MKKLVLTLIIAVLFFFIMFSEYTKDYINFWLVMSITAIILLSLSLLFGKEWKSQFDISLKNIGLGICMAAGLYAIFFVGNIISKELFDFASTQVNLIYGIKLQANPRLIGIALVCLIGPAEEIFWRGYVQRNFSQRYNKWIGLVLSIFCYTFVHISSFNFMLIMAALVCGTFWSIMYMKTNNLVPLIISHSLWDLSIFILFPMV